jgi:hypothetical protein
MMAPIATKGARIVVITGACTGNTPSPERSALSGR